MNQQGGRRRGAGSRPAGPRREPEARTNSPRRGNERGVRVREFRDPVARPDDNGQRPAKNGPRPAENRAGDNGPLVETAGILDLNPQGWGVIRASAAWNDDPKDAFVPQEMIRRYGLRAGQQLAARIRGTNGGGQKRPAAVELISVEGLELDAARLLPSFDRLTAESPTARLRLEHPGGPPSARIIDLLAPMGKGQRGLIIAPPFAGKTRLLAEIAGAIKVNSPEVEIFVLLVDERPEEVTGFRRAGVGHVIASSFDSSPDRHMRIAEMVMERSQRLVEAGKDVAIVIDSLTRLTRASNLSSNGSGRTLSGGLDPAAVRFPRKLFGAARDTQEAGSLTIFATVLVDTESRLDDLIYQEFKGTGNWELRLERSLAEMRLFPAIDIPRSGTRHEELLYSEAELESVQKLRRALRAHGGDAAGQLKLLLAWMDQMPTNDALVRAAARLAPKAL